MNYETSRLILRTLSEEDSSLLLDFIIRNKSYLEEWEPLRSENYFSIESVANIIKQQNDDSVNNKAIHFSVFTKGTNKLIGAINVTNIVYGPFLSCFLGYKMDVEEINKGYMTEALAKTIEICFNEYGLHRIEANVIPRNVRSIKVLEKLNFVCEGTSKKYLKINGVWEDHLHYVLLNDEVEKEEQKRN